MSSAPRIRIKKYFGSANVQQMEVSLEEAQGHLAYFWTKDGSSNVKIAVEGQQINSYEDLVQLSSQDRYKNRGYIDVGLFLSNEGIDSIWPKRA